MRRREPARLDLRPRIRHGRRLRRPVDGDRPHVPGGGDDQLRGRGDGHGAPVRVQRPRAGRLTLPLPWVGSFEVGGLPTWTQVLIAIAVAAAVGAVVELLVSRPLRAAPAVAKVVASIGVLTTLQAAVARTHAGPGRRRLARGASAPARDGRRPRRPIRPARLLDGAGRRARRPAHPQVMSQPDPPAAYRRRMENAIRAGDIASS